MLQTRRSTLGSVAADRRRRSRAAKKCRFTTDFRLAAPSLVSQIAFRSNSTVRLTTSKSYDLLNRLQSISSVGGIVLSDAYTYNDANQRMRVTQADGSYWRYEYDSLGQVTLGKKYWADGTPVAGQQMEYAFDDIGNRTSAKTGGDSGGAGLRTASYTANNLNQYTSRDVSGTVDVLGIANATATVSVNGQSAYRKGEYYQSASAYNNASAALYPIITNTAILSGSTNTVTGNLFVAKTPEGFTYDLDGNQTSDGRWTNRWDAENRLISMESLASAPAGSIRRLTFSYDFMGRRVSKQVEWWTNSAYATIVSNKFVYDGWNLVAELNGTNNAAIRTYLWGLDLSGSMQGAGGVGGLLAVKDSVNATHFAAYDGNGNVTGLFNAADGTSSAVYEYDPFGNLLRCTGPMTKLNPFRFSTKYQDDETDWLYYGYRFYNGSAGKWLSRDPIGNKGGINLHCFVRNDPVGAFDPDGHIKVTTLNANPTTTCGSAEDAYFNFTLDNPAAQDGYIIQENTISIPYAKGIVTGNLWNDHYWEAWFVKKGETSPTKPKDQELGQYKTITDQVSWPGLNKSKGSGGIKGTIKFFFTSKTGDLELPTSGWMGKGWTRGNNVPGAGSLPSIRGVPGSVKFWGDSPDNGEAVANRSVTVKWDCTCNCPDATSTIKVSP